ncbi:hypothetical protein [Labilibaculum euxinus]
MNRELQALPFNHERYSQWVESSMVWLKHDNEGITMTRIQGLGIIDAELYSINKNLINSPLGNDLIVYDIVNIKSYLWVLGVYEFFRMADQKIRENPEIANSNASEIINNVKKEFARIRVPLAKLEPAHKYKNVDYSVPRLGASDEQLGWQINDNEIIYYRYLSDLALSALNQLRISNYEGTIVVI